MVFYQFEKTMNKRLLIVLYFSLVSVACMVGQTRNSVFKDSLGLQVLSKPIQSDGLFFTDVTQTKLYTGGYREFYENGALKLEMTIINGKPEGPYVVYYSNGKPREVRSYLNGQFHGVWRTYNASGNLVSQAEYLNDKKHGRWMVWDDNGILRYDMEYTKGKKTGTWSVWDEKGHLISEKTYQ
jgi:antitoxin component YwqK of YwqJK toxin-antitoxin module